MYSYLQCIGSTLCKVTGSNCTVPYVQLPAVYGQKLMYSYRQFLDSNLCKVSSSIWTVTYVQILAVYGQ